MSSDDEIAQDLQSAAALDTCHCCDVPTATPIFNRPGLSALAYRIGTYATFFEQMKAAIPQATSPTTGGRPLAAFTTRDLDDPSIALLDAAAVLGDILTFYQERIANEGFLRTATERRSILELAREIGYELNPGVAASTYLAFIVDKALAPVPGLPMPSQIPLASGLKVQSVPSPGQMPQTFETTAPITARVAWNALGARSTQRQELAVDATTQILYRADPGTGHRAIADSLWLDGVQTNVRNGDLLWVGVGPESWPQDPVAKLEQGIACVFVSNIEIDYTKKRTKVELSQSAAQPAPPYSDVKQTKGAVSLVQLPLTLGNVREYVVGRYWEDADLRAYIAVQNWNEDELLALVAQAIATEPPAAEVYVFRARCGMFGNQAPLWQQLDTAWQSLPTPRPPEPWPNPWDGNVDIYKSSAGGFWSTSYFVDVLLDRSMQLAVGTRCAFGSVDVSPPVPMHIKSVRDVAAVDFGMSARVTGLGLEIPFTGLPSTGGIDKAYVRDTTAYVQSEPLALTDAPILETVGDDKSGATEFILDRMVLGLSPGQYLILTGTVAFAGESTGKTATEVCQVASVSHNRGYTTVQFANALQRAYVRDSITINANVAPATHGETVTDEILGSGDATQKNQTFQLAKPPLTYVVAPTASGGEDTLTLRVNGVAWQEVPTLYGCGPTDTVYTVRLQDDGTTMIRFGDGTVGARLPTGTNNILATYRSGLGPAGNLGAEAISILATRPYALKSGLNPVPSTGGAAAEPLADARQNAPRTVRTLDRIVSIDDYTDFARGFAGVGKALAVPLWSGEREIVHITVAGSDGATIDPNGDQWKALVAGILDAGPGTVHVRVDNFLRAYFKLTATIIVDARYELPVVVAQVTSALRTAFSFGARDLAQTVTEAEAIEIALGVPGVVAFDITQLYRTGQPATLAGTLPAAGAHFFNHLIVPAELLLLHPVGLSLVGVNP